MANQLGHPGVSPRCYKQHQRYARFGHVSKSKQFEAFLVKQVARLSVATYFPATAMFVMFKKLTVNTAADIVAADTFGVLNDYPGQ